MIRLDEMTFYCYTFSPSTTIPMLVDSPIAKKKKKKKKFSSADDFYQGLQHLLHNKHYNLHGKRNGLHVPTRWTLSNSFIREIPSNIIHRKSKIHITRRPSSSRKIVTVFCVNYVNVKSFMSQVAHETGAYLYFSVV